MTKTRWDYTSKTVAPGESWYDVLREQGQDGWEAWHIEKKPDGWREIYFKKPFEDRRALSGEPTP